MATGYFTNLLKAGVDVALLLTVCDYVRSGISNTDPLVEAGTVGALPAVVNALIDALSEFGVDHIEMPATPERIWRAMRRAERSAAALGRRQ